MRQRFSFREQFRRAMRTVFLIVAWAVGDHGRASVEGLAAAIALDIRLQDRGVVDETIDGRERHAWSGKICPIRRTADSP